MTRGDESPVDEVEVLRDRAEDVRAGDAHVERIGPA
jgi:hypothetical protein